MKRYIITITTRATVNASNQEEAKRKAFGAITQANQFLGFDEAISPDLEKVKVKKLPF